MSKVQVGDIVRVVKDHGVWLKEVDIDLSSEPVLTTLKVVDCEYAHLRDKEIWIQHIIDWPQDFELVSREQGGQPYFLEYVPEAPTVDEPEVILPVDLGVYRPNLEDRKVGKVRVELVDDGFPLALREIAKVMTWAQTAKGYKDHDWQKLPNPEQGLAGATSRHRTDHIIQRHVGNAAAIECTDHESDILHKAHEAFGVLAQLELILRGVIK